MIVQGYPENALIAIYCKVDIAIGRNTAFYYTSFIKKSECSICRNEEKKYLCARFREQNYVFYYISLKKRANYDLFTRSGTHVCCEERS